MRQRERVVVALSKLGGLPIAVPARDIQRRAETACLLTHFLPIYVKQSSDIAVMIRTVFDKQIAKLKMNR